MIKAALIDMDGVLYDSMPYHAKAWHQMLGEQGIITDPDEFFLYEGMTGGDTINLIFKRELGREATEEEKIRLYGRKSEIFKSSGKKTLMKGTPEVLTALRKRGITTVLVTGSAQGSLLEKLDVDYPGCFPAHRRVTALDVEHGKPNPEPYLKGLIKSGVNPEEAIVIENAPLGVRAGKAAGLFTIAVMTGPIPRSEFEKEGADLIFGSMEELEHWIEERREEKDRFQELARDIDRCIENLSPATVVVVTDSNVDKMVLPLLSESKFLARSPKVIIESGELHKNLDSLIKIWECLETNGATRKSLIVNVGGGMVTDIGGFAAATFKRGLRYINIPTTLLGAVDAATGGKTGINFKGLKNEIGSFHNPSGVIISALPVASLPLSEQLSGYGEMLKTALISDEILYNSLLDVKDTLSRTDKLEELIKTCVAIKEEIVELDPKETGLRKVLNFGHTAGHAFESMFLQTLPHGMAVAHGILVELLLSVSCKGLEPSIAEKYALMLRENYPKLNFDSSMQNAFMELMKHDKKNAVTGTPNFTLLEEIGKPVTDCYPTEEAIFSALKDYLTLMNPKS